MIQQIDVIEGGYKHPLFTKITSLYNAYGSGHSFCQFYKGDGVLISRYYNNLIVYIIDDSCDLGEIRNFISFSNATNIQCNQKLCELEGYSYSSGRIYSSLGVGLQFRRDNFVISSRIDHCFDILKDIFIDEIGQGGYDDWYLDMSHRVRHLVTSVYTIIGKATATAYATDENYVVVTQVATRREHRNCGLAAGILEKISKDNAGKQLAVLSKDDVSDRFYEKIGFRLYGVWHEYRKVEWID